MTSLQCHKLWMKKEKTYSLVNWGGYFSSRKSYHEFTGKCAMRKWAERRYNVRLGLWRSMQQSQDWIGVGSLFTKEWLNSDWKLSVQGLETSEGHISENDIYHGLSVHIESPYPRYLTPVGCKYHRNRNVFSHRSGDWKYVCRVPEPSGSGENPLPELQRGSFSLCPHMTFLQYRSNGEKGLSLPLLTI